MQESWNDASDETPVFSISSPSCVLIRLEIPDPVIKKVNDLLLSASAYYSY